MQRAEREARDLRASSADIETLIARLRKEVEAATAKVKLLEEQLNVESSSRLGVQRNARRVEKRIAELTAMLEEEKRATERFKEEVHTSHHNQYTHLHIAGGPRQQQKSQFASAT